LTSADAALYSQRVRLKKMILPQTHIGTLIVMILSLLCIGLWANTYKLAGKLRFEVYYADFAVGLGLAAVIFAFTFGNLGFDGFSVLDDMMQVHKRQWLDAFGAGVIFNLANMLLVAAISVSGMAAAIPMALGLTLVVGVLWGQVSQRTSNPLFLYLGCVLVLAAVVADAVAHKSLVAIRRAAMRQAAIPKGKKDRGPGAIKGVILSVISGLLMSGIYPLLKAASTGDVALGPYSLMLLFAVGAFLSTFVFSLFFMNLPVQGQPLEIRDYFKTGAMRHLFGVLGGILWCAGTQAVFVAARTAPEAQLGPAATLALSNGGTLVAGLCGLLVWREFQEGVGRPKTLAFAALILFAVGLALASLALV
jgi:glucose uptake protein